MTTKQMYVAEPVGDNRYKIQDSRGTTWASFPSLEGAQEYADECRLRDEASRTIIEVYHVGYRLMVVLACGHRTRGCVEDFEGQELTCPWCYRAAIRGQPVPPHWYGGIDELSRM